MIWTIYEICLNLFEGFLFTWFITKMLIKKRTEYFSFFGCGILTAAALSSYLFFDMPEWDTWTFMFILLYSLFFFSDSVILKLFWVSITVVASMGWAGISYHLFALFYKADISQMLEPGIVRVIFTAAANAALWLILFLITKVCPRKSQTVNPTYLLIVTNLLCILLIDIFFSSQDKYHLPLSWLLSGCIITLIIGIVTVVTYRMMISYVIREQQYQFQEQQLKNYRNQMETLQEAYNVTRQIRHDINAYINDFKNYAEHEGLKEYPEFLQQLEKQAIPSHSTGNSALDSLLPIKIRKICSLGIEFRASNLHYTGGMNINDLSLCSLITNMLDNAIEALEERKEIAGERYIDLEFIYSPAGLMILCENPLLGQRPKMQGDAALFSKKKEPFHGLGISIMERIAQDAGGQLDIVICDDLFRVFALIPPSKENETETDKTT